MPIRFVDRPSTVVGRVAASTAAHTALISGTFSVVGSNAGTIATALGNHAAAITGVFLSGSQVSGTIGVTLSNHIAAVAGTFTAPGNQPPVWATLADQTLTIGVPFQINFDQGLCNDPEGQPITYTITAGSLPPGITQSGTRGEIISGTATTAGNFTVTFLADDSGSAASEWTARKASVAAGLILSEDFSTYSDRAAWMAHMLAVRDTGNKVVVNYAYTGVSASDPANYGPVPSGQQEKIGFDTTNFLTAGKSAYVRFRAGEAASDNGPTFGIPIDNPASKMYFQADVMFDGPAITNDYASSNRKILFLNAHDFESEQIVLTMIDDHGPWPCGYRIAFSPHTGNTTTRLLARRHTSPPTGFGGDERCTYSAYDASPGSAYPTTVTAFKQRFGPSRDFPDLAGTDPDYAAVPRIIPGRWYTLTSYIDQDWVSTTGERGMWKLWLQEQGLPPALIGLNFQDCRFGTFASSPSSSIRPVFRPELSTNDPGNFPSGVDHGVRFDKLLVSTVPPTAYGYALPYPGQQIPPGMPIANTTDE